MVIAYIMVNAEVIKLNSRNLPSSVKSKPVCETETDM